MSLTSSYLDHLDARLEKQGGRGSLSRLLLVAKKGEAADDPDAVVRYHERVSTALYWYEGRGVHSYIRVNTWYRIYAPGIIHEHTVYKQYLVQQCYMCVRRY